MMRVAPGGPTAGVPGSKQQNMLRVRGVSRDFAGTVAVGHGARVVCDCTPRIITRLVGSHGRGSSRGVCVAAAPRPVCLVRAHVPTFCCPVAGYRHNPVHMLAARVCACVEAWSRRDSRIDAMLFRE
jgi:hypothetical protein